MPEDAPTRILSVGQCGADHGTITRYFRRAFAAEVVPADDLDEALATLRDDRSFRLVLVNRVTDADGTSGLDLIRAIRSQSGLAGLPLMLVSNYEDAQAEAVALGALPGIGKAWLNTPDAKERLASVLAADGG